jgi:hypothetical protein
MRAASLLLTLMAVILVMAACSDRKEPDEAKPQKPTAAEAQPQPSVNENKSTTVLSKPSPTLPSGEERERQQIKQLLSEIRQQSNPGAFAKSKWSEFWKPAFDQPWSSKDGKSLNQIIEGFAAGQQPGFNQVLKDGGEPWASDPELKTSAVALATLSASVFSAPTSENSVPASDLPQLVGANRDRMPPTVGDVMVYRIIAETSAFFESRPKMPEAQLSSWVGMSQAKNPLYRLMALEVFGKFDATPEQAQAFYSKYLSETETGINQALAKSLSGRGDEWAVSVLPQVQAKIPKN